LHYYPHTGDEIKKALDAIGVESIDQLFRDLPQNKLIKELDLPEPLSEDELVRTFTRMAERNRSFYDKPNFLGAGVYQHFLPSVVDAIVSRSEFYTSYTPYQAEASQGVLQSIFEYQTLICQLTGMDVSNASLYDGSTACAEAASLALNQTRKKEILYSTGLHPEYVEVLKTYFKHYPKVVLKEIPLVQGQTCIETLEKEVSSDTAGVIIQNPNCLGFIEQAEKLGKVIKKNNSRALYIITITEPLSLGILRNPGSCGADVAVGEAAGLGLPPSFGGPHLGFMAVKSKYLRKIPGRLVGQTVDANGKRAFCLTLQAREQHIRRDRATSNICTNQALCALAATVYLCYLGKEGFSQLARLNMAKAHYLKNRLEKNTKCKLIAEKPFFNEFTVSCPDDPVKIERFLFRRNIIGGFITGRWRSEWKDFMTFCATELNSKKEIDDLAGYLEAFCREEVNNRCLTF